MVTLSLVLLSLVSQAFTSPVESESLIEARSNGHYEDAALSDLGISKLRRRHLERRGVRVAFTKAKAFADPSPDIPTDTILSLESVPGEPLSRKYLSLLDEEAIIQADEKKEEIQNIRDSVYLTTMKFGDETFKLVIDTGSADTWLVRTGFKCISMLTKQATAPASCRFARTYNTTKSYVEVKDQHFNISYADGEFLNGDMGKELVTFGGIQVPDQEFGLITLAAWNGDSVSSGLTGLAFPSVTRAFAGANPKGDRRGANIPYDPIFTSMWKKKLVAPHFSVALNRAGESAGVIALGGLPNPASGIKYEDKFAKAPMQHLSIAKPAGAKSQDYQLYVVETDGWNIVSPGGNKATDVLNTKTKVVLDTGTTLSYLPPAIANAINKNFDPPATSDPLSRNFIVKCNAKAPSVAMRIGGMDVKFDGKDIIMNMGKSNSAGMCMSGIQASKSALQPSILGGVFLKNVVTVFDIGAAEMRFANRIR